MTKVRIFTSIGSDQYIVGMEFVVRNYDGEETVSVMADSNLSSSEYTTEEYDFDSDKVLIGFQIIFGRDESLDPNFWTLRKMALIYDDVDAPEDTINEFSSPEGRKPILYYRRGGRERTMGILNMKLNLKPSGEASYSLASGTSWSDTLEVEMYFDDYHVNNINVTITDPFLDLSTGDHNDVIIVRVTPDSHTYLAWDMPITLRVLCHFT